MSAANLEELRANVEAIAASIIALKKAEPVNKEAIATAVKDLLDAKRTFADNNNGIGVDGKPFEEPMSKSDKKKADKKKREENVATESNKQVRASLRKLWKRSLNSDMNMMIPKHSKVHPKTELTTCLRNKIPSEPLSDSYYLQKTSLFDFECKCFNI
jgi:hypothetical protein